MLAVALQRLEIVQRHDAMRAEGVKRGDDHDLEPRRRAGSRTAAPVNQGSPS